MQLSGIQFGVTDWSLIEPTEHKGQTGVALWRTQHFGNIRVRMVEYTAGYLADHWCEKGHILLCLDGELTTELKDGSKHVLKPGMSYQVSDGQEAHRSFTHQGARLFIVD
jgi:quercetin dioxygenase-like cupin family protein